MMGTPVDRVSDAWGFRMQSWFRALWPSLALMALGCMKPPLVRPEAGRFASAEALLQAMRAGEPGSLRVSGTADMRRGGKRIKARMTYLVRLPADLRFQTESFFEQPWSILVADGMRFSAWDMRGACLSRGERHRPTSPGSSRCTWTGPKWRPFSGEACRSCLTPGLPSPSRRTATS